MAVALVGNGAETAHFDRRFEIGQGQRDAGLGGVEGGDIEILGSNALRLALAGDFEARFDVGDGVEVDGIVAARPVDLLAPRRQLVALGLDGLLLKPLIPAPHHDHFYTYFQRASAFGVAP